LKKVILFPGEIVNEGLISASAIQRFLHWQPNAVIINPNIVGKGANAEDSVQAASHVLLLVWCTIKFEKRIGKTELPSHAETKVPALLRLGVACEFDHQLLNVPRIRATRRRQR
jgi:hypothetical protein